MPNESWETKLKKAEILKAEAEARKIELEILGLQRRDSWMGVESGETASSLIFNFDFPVTASTVHETIHHLTRWSRRWPGEKITIIFNSPGGEVTEGLALYDFIQELKRDGTEIETVSIGMAASMAAILLQAGDNRIMSRNAHMLIHEVTAMTWGNASQIADEMKFIEMLQDKILDILSDRSTLSKRQVKTRWQRTDWWIDATKALEYGFCDEVRM